MSFPRIEPRVVQIFHHIEARVTRLFRLGAALRPPGLSEFGRKVAQFIARNFPNHEHRPTIVVPHPSRAPASVRSADPADPTVEGLERPFFKRREEMLDEERAPAPAAPARFNSVEIAQQDTSEEVGNPIPADATQAATEFVSTLKEAAAEAGEALGKKATEFVEAAKESLSNAIDWFTGSPPPPPPAAEAYPKVISEERRQELEKSIESQTEMHWVGLKKLEEPKPSEVQHLQPAIKRWDDKPKPEPTFYDGKAERAREEMREKTNVEPPPEPPHVAPFTDEEEKNATTSARRVEEELNTEVLKQQEEEIAKQNAEAANKRKQKPEPPPKRRFDPTQAKKFEHWGEPPGSTVTAQPSNTMPNRSLGDKTQKIDAAELEKEVRTVVRTIIPPRSILRRNDPSGIPRVPRKVQFSDEVEERFFEETAEEKAAKLKAMETIDEKNVLREVHEEMHHWHATGDRFIRLMLIALDNTELPSKRRTDPHKMAIELYGSFVNEAPPDEWAERAESSIREQLEARTRDEALSALEPIIEHFGRYARTSSEDDNDGLRTVHERLGQLGRILHKLRDEQIMRTES